MQTNLLARRLIGATSPGWRTRFAPAPTGWLHLGHVVNAVYVWGLARAAGGRVVLRVEDHDAKRCRPDYVRGVGDDLEWLGLVPDEVAPPQSERTARYEAVLKELESRRAVYACTCSRRDLSQAAGDVFGEETRYPGTCRACGIDFSVTPARRVVMESRNERFDDLALGTHAQDPAAQCGDVLVRDRDGQWTYQFAVVVDDIDQRIDVVIRGEDLLASTGRQIQLARLLGRAKPPAFLHHPLVRHDDGSKLSKSNRDTGVRELRAAGWTAEKVLGEATRLGGLVSVVQSLAARDLASMFE